MEVIPSNRLHEFYKSGDKKAPTQIKDRNGDVVLTMCKNCGKAEGELTDENCKGVDVKRCHKNTEEPAHAR